jgi:hypothetical protein
MTITGADERLHPVEDPADRWSDTHAFTVWDADAGLFLLARVAVLPNLPAATAAVLGWFGAKPVYAYGHGTDEVPLADWDDLTVAAVRVQEIEPLRSWELTVADGANALSLRWDGFSGTVPFPGLVPAVAAGHYEQACAVTGNVGLNGHDVRVDGAGSRSHTWGVRAPEAVAGWHAITGSLGGTATAFSVWEVRALDGTVTVDGYVHDGGEDRRLVAAEVGHADGGEGDLSLELTDEGGHRLVVRGVHHGADVPVRPAGSLAGTEVLHQRLVRLEAADGRQGFGLSEVLEHREAGAA